MPIVRSWIIGSSPDCDMVVNHAYVSGQHCRLTQTDTGMLLEDLGSTNGTFVNGARLDKPVVISRRDRITLGQTAAMPWPEIDRDIDVAEPLDPALAETKAESVDTNPVTKSSQKAPTAPMDSLGRYQIEKKLGSGAMGDVFLALDTQLHRKVALKIPKFKVKEGSVLVERFRREARSAAVLRHPNICPVFDVGEIDGTLYLTMAFIEGRELSDYISADRPLPETWIVQVMRKLALALDEAHSLGIVHRDLKPGNIMIDQRGQPIIMDFGLARQTTRSDQNIKLTQDGAIVGTPAYMPPEQVQGQTDLIAPASDIWSLGVILFKMLTGRLPFEGAPMLVLRNIVAIEPPKPSEIRPDVDPRLEAICLKMISKKQEDRFASMEAAAEALGDVMKKLR